MPLGLPSKLKSYNKVTTSRSSTAKASGGSRATSSGSSSVRSQIRTVGFGGVGGSQTTAVSQAQANADAKVQAALAAARQRVAAGLGMVDARLGALPAVGQALSKIPASRAQVRQIVAEQAARLGWTGAELAALDKLIMKESGYNPNAQNPTSTAYGIFQFLNKTWKGVGATKTSDPNAQTAAGLRYIQQRYGSPSKALRFHLGHNWY